MSKRLICAWAMLLAFALFLPASASAGVPRPGDPAPKVVGQTLDGQPFDLGTLRGQVVIANVWATWCPPCRAEMPTLNAFYLANRASGVTLVGLSADRARDEDEVRRAMRGINYPAVLLNKAKVNSLGIPSALPVTLIIDGTGVVRAVLVPKNDQPLTAAQLNVAVAPLLAPKTPS